MIETPTFYPKTIQEWRDWLAENHHQENSVWLVMYNKSAEQPTVTWSQAVDQALCYGWIDSIKKKLDHESTIQFFSKRKPKSTWSKINKQKVQTLMDAGLMTKAGMDCIDKAKQNGSWTILDEVEELLIPEDFQAELNARPPAMDFFLSLSKSTRKGMLHWIVLAKRPETRHQRIIHMAELAAKHQKAKQF